MDYIPLQDMFVLTTVEINPTELCNLKCEFCPRSQGYPNLNEHMSEKTIIKSFQETSKVAKKYQKKITFAITGRGEPALSKNYKFLLTVAAEYQKDGYIDVIINTNGHKFEEYLPLYEKLHQVTFNVYYNYSDQEFEELKQRYGKLPFLRVHRRTVGQETRPVFYNNRAGTIKTPLTTGVIKGTCEKPLTNLFIDWNGDYNLCCNDWGKNLVLGNIHTTGIEEFYFGKTVTPYKTSLFFGDRKSLHPCRSCNAKPTDTVLKLVSNSPEKVTRKI